jgi:hypothetical protein
VEGGRESGQADGAPLPSEDKADVAAVKQQYGKKSGGGKKRSKAGKPAADVACLSLCSAHSPPKRAPPPGVWQLWVASR